jgi:hypothetical protein
LIGSQGLQTGAWANGLDHGIERRIHRRDALQVRLDHFGGRDTLVADGLGNAGRRCVDELIHALLSCVRHV